MKICFEDTITGQLLYINETDTLHWYMGDVIGYIYNESTFLGGGVPVYFVSIKVSFKNPQNIYFLPTSDIAYSNSQLASTYATTLFFPYKTDYFAVYSSQSTTSFTSYDEWYGEGYRQGQDDILNNTDYRSSEYQRGRENGLTEGELIGHNLGYNEGYQQAITENTDYSFKGLITSVIDVPIYTIFGLLDFNLLGVNMKSLFLSLFTIVIVIFIVRLVLGGL